MSGSSTPTSGVNIPPANADLATTWAHLEEGVDHIMTKLHTGVSYSKYMGLYTVAYNYRTSSKMPAAQDPTQARCKWSGVIPVVNARSERFW